LSRAARLARQLFFRRINLDQIGEEPRLTRARARMRCQTFQRREIPLRKNNPKQALLEHNSMKQPQGD
jgi:hypothetical protein